ncbi:MAG: sigma-54 dependent transcriptional regulator [Myxococcales bacterium]|nr:sigma-54 dependent transcriptional regulator [Myxococcales bacterium]
MPRIRVLVADDEPTIRLVLREALEEDGHEVVDVVDGDAALAVLSREEFHVAFLDIRMPGCSGLELMERMSSLNLDVAVVIITAQNTFENVVEAMKLGALDYLVKPFGLQEVRAVLAKALRNRAMESELRELRIGYEPKPAERGESRRLVGSHPDMVEVFKTIGRLASRHVSVLITGERGTGKEVVARAIHAASDRNRAPFCAVHLSAIPEAQLEREVFDAESGVIRKADGGTLFFDEISDLSPELQLKLLRFLEDGDLFSGERRRPVDVRVLAATQRDLEVAVGEGQFREDLLYRLRVVPLHLPPLRERVEDIPLLAQHFVDRFGGELSDGRRFLAPATLELLGQGRWMGNVRELESAIKRALVLSRSEVLSPEDFGFLSAPKPAGARQEVLSSLVEAEVQSALEGKRPEIYRYMIEQVEKSTLETVLAHTEGNQIKAASLLGINRNTLRKKIGDLGIKLSGRGPNFSSG